MKEIYLSEEQEMNFALNKANCRYKPLALNEFAIVFPQCGSIIKNQIKEKNKRFAKLTEKKRQTEEKIENMKISYKDKEVYNIVYGTWWDLHIADVEKQLKDYRYILKALDFRGNMSKSHITDQHIIEAKQKPITDYVLVSNMAFAHITPKIQCL